MALQAGIEHPFHPRMPFQEAGHRQTVGVVPFHSQGERLETTLEKIGVVGGVYATHDAAEVADRLQLLLPTDDDARQQVVVPAEIFRR